MRSKREIEHQFEHMKSGCPGDPAVNAHWIEALEWVLGDEAHRADYEKAIRTLVESGKHEPGDTAGALATQYALNVALDD